MVSDKQPKRHMAGKKKKKKILLPAGREALQMAGSPNTYHRWVSASQPLSGLIDAGVATSDSPGWRPGADSCSILASEPSGPYCGGNEGGQPSLSCLSSSLRLRPIPPAPHARRKLSTSGQVQDPARSGRKPPPFGRSQCGPHSDKLL